MKPLVFAAIPAVLLFAGCQFDMTHDESTSAKNTVDNSPTEWQALPEGRSYLFTGLDSNQIPNYTPVTFTDSLALIEGDIVIASGVQEVEELRAKLVDPREDKPVGLAKSSGFVLNTAYTGKANAWPNAVIPYIAVGNVDKVEVERAVYEFNQAGGISYIPWDQKTYPVVVFVKTNDPFANSQVGMVSANGVQYIRLPQAAVGRSTLMHEMAHTAGMYHEQMRPDRATYVNITTTGTDDSGWFNSNWAIKNDGNTVGVYDQKSIMHYGSGTVTYKHATGANYTVTMTAINGQALGGAVFTATDKSSLWGIGVNAIPLRPVALLPGIQGKVTKLFNTFPNFVAKKFICTYDPVTGVANITSINSDNTLGNSLQNINVGGGFNLIAPYFDANKAPCLMFYNSTNGYVRLFYVNSASGLVGANIASGYWGTGWSTIEYYQSEGKMFLFFQNKTNFLVNIWSVNTLGNIQSLTYSDTWTNWTFFRPFYSETSLGKNSAFFLFAASTGLTRIRSMPGTGSIGNIVADVSLPGTPVGLWQSVTKAVLATVSGTTMYLFDMDNRGFRTTGTTIFRVGNLGNTISRIDAANDVGLVNYGAAIVDNRYFDYQHVLAYQYTNIQGSVFLGSGAPFH